jgi:hypothetical protein
MVIPESLFSKVIEWNCGWHVPEVPPKGVVVGTGRQPRPSLEAPGVPPKDKQNSRMASSNFGFLEHV